MANISSDEFLAGLKKSGIVQPKRLVELLENINGNTPEAIAQQLVRDGSATVWQAKYLLSGRSRLDIGSYRLLERISRNEFGDLFLAVQTSLARKVDLQVLPGALTNDKSNRDRFIQKASLAAQLDHPNLVHVYDIDQEDGRFFLVTEHIVGKTLEATDASKLSDLMIANIISQAIDGISYAHQQNVIHGCIGPADLMLDNEQQVKIQHLPLSPLRQQLSGNEDQPTTVDDFSAIARIGSFLLQKSNVPDATRRAELADTFEQLSAATPESATAASNALRQFVAAASTESESDPGGFDQPIATTSIRREKKWKIEEKTKEPEEIEPSNYLGHLWRDNPIAVIGTSLVIALMLIGGSVYGGITLLNKLSPAIGKQVHDEHPGTNNNQDPSTKIKKKPDAKPTTGRLSSNLNDDELDLAIPSEKTMNGVLANLENDGNNSEPAVTTSTDDAATTVADTEPAITFPPVNPNANPNSDNGNEDSAAVVVTNVVAKPTTPQQPSPENEPPSANDAGPIHTDLTVISGIAEKTQATLNKGDVKSLEQMAAMSPEDIQAALRKGGRRNVNQMAEYKSWISQAKETIGDESPINTRVEAKGAFENFPGTAELPPLENTTEIKIADLVIKNQYLLGAELICEQGAVKGRTTFELERSPEDKQKWIVGVKKAPNQDGIPIAAFRKSEEAFHFQWLPEAASNKNAAKLAPYLRNCFVKLMLPEDKATILTLRKPMKIADLRLTEDSLSNELEFLIPAMPEPENIVVEVIPLRIPGVDTRIPNSRVERGNPARIWLKKDDKTGFLWIQVSGELRSKMILRSNLTLLVQGQMQPVRGLKALEDLAQTLDAAAIRARWMYDQFSRPINMTKTDYGKKKAELLKEAKAQQALKDKIMNYGEILPKILNQPISVRVYSKLGNYQTVLAVSDPTIEQEKK